VRGLGFKRLMSHLEPFDHAAYLERVGFSGTPAPDLATLQGLHVAHLDRIPFENLDVRLGRPVLLDLAALQAKLVAARRGGYCFEQNTLFAAALRSFGFEVETLEARVRPPGATTPTPRTHMLLRTEIGGRAWLADVGFGGDGPLLPVPLDGEPSEQPDGLYRVDQESDGTRVLRLLRDGSSRDLYAFGLSPALPIDFEVANHYTSSHPRSPFVRTLTVQRSTSDQRHILRGRSYTVRMAGVETAREIADTELPSLLRTRFRLDVPDEDALRALGSP
jgi:N-hydroxyarylamine O-acetyltransferase